jgi:transposase
MGVAQGADLGHHAGGSAPRHVPVDVLPDASADSFAAWLKAHPGVELITRDRAGAFADGAAVGAPKALQSADRWHLLRNLSEALKKVLARHHDSLKRAFTPQQEQPDPPPAPAPVIISHAERIHQSRRDRRLARYQEVRQLYEQGWSFASLARMLGMNKKTVAKFVHAEQFPEARPRGDRRRKLTPYLPYLRKQWEAGEQNAAQLHRDIRAQGCAWLGNDDTSRPLGTARPDRAAHRASPPSSSLRPQEIPLAARRAFESSGAPF